MTQKLKFIKVTRRPALDEYEQPSYELAQEILEIPQKAYDNAVLEDVEAPPLGKIKKLSYGNRVWLFVLSDHAEIQKHAGDPEWESILSRARGLPDVKEARRELYRALQQVPQDQLTPQDRQILSLMEQSKGLL
jgi:hypothetical protein